MVIFPPDTLQRKCVQFPLKRGALQGVCSSEKKTIQGRENETVKHTPTNYSKKENENVKKRIFSLFLAVCMIVSLLPMSVFAEEAVTKEANLYMRAEDGAISSIISNNGVAQYFYTKDGYVCYGNTMLDAEGNVVEEGGVKANEDNYNIKFVYPEDGNPTIYLRRAEINNGASYGLQFGAIYEAATTKWIPDGLTYDVVIVEESSIENTAS